MPRAPKTFRPTGPKPKSQPIDRQTACQRGYDRRWREAAREFLRAHPLCAICQREGLIVAAECVDHIVPHKGDAALFWDVANWQPACIACNSAKGDSTEPRRRRQADTEPGSTAEAAQDGD